MRKILAFAIAVLTLSACGEKPGEEEGGNTAPEAPKAIALSQNEIKTGAEGGNVEISITAPAAIPAPPCCA